MRKSKYFRYFCTMPKESDNKKATLALGTLPVGKLLFQYAMPAIIAMVASSMYNIIDRSFYRSPSDLSLFRDLPSLSRS